MARFLLSPESIENGNSFVIEDIKVDPLFNTFPDDTPLALVTPTGDINGDETDDILVQSFLSSIGSDFEPENFVIYGSDSFPDTISQTDINGNNGFNFSDDVFIASGGQSINGDNLNELFVFTSDLTTGTTNSSVVLGSNQIPETVDINALDGNNGFTVSDGNKSVTTISFIGDINNDDINELFFISTGVEGENVVQTNKVFFGLENYPANLDISTPDGNNGFSVIGTANIAGAGANFNGDEFEDLIFTEPENPRGYVVFGRSEFAAEVDLNALSSGQGFTITDETADPNENLSAGFSEDINGDGLSDIVLQKLILAETPEEQTSGVLSRGAFVIYSRGENTATTFDLAEIDGNNGFTIAQPEVGVRGVLDINGDDLQDLFFTNDADEKSYVVFGGANIPNNFDLNTLDGSNGFVIENANFGAGLLFNVGLLGDINGDGLNDVVIGNEDLTIDNPDYILLGSQEFPASIDLTDPEANVIELSGEGATEGISAFADVNGDDVDDIIFYSQLNEEDNTLANNTVLFGDRDLSFVTDNSGEPGDNAPTVVTPIDDLNFEAGEDRTIDLSNVFEDADDDEIVIAVASNSNEELVTTSIEENNLILDFAEDTNGTADITLRATANGQTVDDTFTVTVGEEPDEQTIELFRFRNTTFDTGTYIFVAEAERDFILDNEDLSNTFSLDGRAEDGTVNPAFTASTEDGDGLIPFFRLESLTVPGTFLFVSTAEYEFIFDDPIQQEQWKKQGFADEDETEDIPEFYLRDGSADSGTAFNRFQNQQNNTFLYAGGGEIDAIEDNPDLANLFDNQGVAFKSLT